MAASLAARLTKELNAEVELIEGHGGAFEVSVDGELFFSRLLTGHFPNEDRLLKDLS